MRKDVVDAYKAYGISVSKVLKKMEDVVISLQCWQLDDVQGFESNELLTGGIQATGNHPGKANGFKELTEDLDEALKFIPGKKNINLHAIYQSDNAVDRKDITIDNFRGWVDFARERNLGLDFNPTLFSSPMLKDGLTLSSPDEEIRNYWVEHCINSIKVTEEFGKLLGRKSLCNIWIPDGLKESPSDRIGPRKRLKHSLEEIVKTPYDKRYMDISVESKVFGIGVESYTVGSNEFYLSFALKNNILCLLDTGHFHPTENVADKISSLLMYSKSLALHISRPVRWDSDHVVKLDDNLQDVTDELVKCDMLYKAHIGLDFFDASINRVLALIIGARNVQKAILKSLLTPWDLLKEAQDTYDHSKVLALQEEVKALPWNEVWNAFLEESNMVSDSKMYEEIMNYEKEVQLKREK